MDEESPPPGSQAVDVDGETVGVLLADGGAVLFRAFKPIVAALDWTRFQSAIEGRRIVERHVRTTRQFAAPSGPSGSTPDSSQ